MSDTTQVTPKPNDTDPQISSTSQGDNEKNTSVSVHLHTGAAPEVKDFLETDAGKAFIEKVRTEERSKLHGRVQKSKTDQEQVTKERDDALAQQAALQAKLDAAQAEDSATTDDIATQMQQLKVEVQTATAAAEAAKQESARMIRQSEIKVYRTQQIADNKVVLSALVPEIAESEEAIDAAIKLALVEQEKVAERTRIEVRKEMGVPAPLAPGQDGGGDTTNSVMAQMADPHARNDVARMSPEEYAKWRKEAGAQAEEAAGFKR